MKHVRDQNWLAVGIDFFIVIVGVFIGIQVANWNEARQNKALIEDYLDRLTADLVTEQALWQAAIDYFGTARAYGLAALDGFDRPTEELDAGFLAAVYQASQVWFVAPNRATFDELQSTGRITLIEDPDLRTILANHYLRSAQTGVTLQQNSQYRRVARLDLGQAVQNAVREHCGDRWVTDENNFYFVVLPSSCEIDLPPDLLRNQIAAIHANTEIQRELRFHISVLDAGEPLNKSTRSAFQSEKPQIVRAETSDSSRSYGRVAPRARCGFSGETPMGRAFAGSPPRLDLLIWNDQTTLAQAKPEPPAKTPSRPRRLVQRFPSLGVMRNTSDIAGQTVARLIASRNAP